MDKKEELVKEIIELLLSREIIHSIKGELRYEIFKALNISYIKANADKEESKIDPNAKLVIESVVASYVPLSSTFSNTTRQ